ncbi:MAG: hypothetical protein H0T78_10065, partial [Longispora sp.]|nr:hypothetical protein [Longispora sp. (in: high G+C Gram-positive bacteria)]
MRKELRFLATAMLGIGLMLGPATASYADNGATTIVAQIVPPKAEPLEGRTKVWTVPNYIAAWQEANGREMTQQERQTLALGCIGITGVNVHSSGGPHLDLSFSSLEKAKEVQQHLDAIFRTKDITWHGYAEALFNDRVLADLDNATSTLKAPNGDENAPIGDIKAVIYSKRFWSGQDANWSPQVQDTKFRPNPNTGQVDMTEYKNLSKGQAVNFDYGYFDEATNTFWHANHGEPRMEIYQSTLEWYSQPYDFFDRQTFGVSLVWGKRGDGADVNAPVNPGLNPQPANPQPVVPNQPVNPQPVPTNQPVPTFQPAPNYQPAPN